MNVNGLEGVVIYATAITTKCKYTRANGNSSMIYTSWATIQVNSPVHYTLGDYVAHDTGQTDTINRVYNQLNNQGG